MRGCIELFALVCHTMPLAVCVTRSKIGAAHTLYVTFSVSLYGHGHVVVMMTMMMMMMMGKFFFCCGPAGSFQTRCSTPDIFCYWLAGFGGAASKQKKQKHHPGLAEIAPAHSE